MCVPFFLLKYLIGKFQPSCWPLHTGFVSSNSKMLPAGSRHPCVLTAQPHNAFPPCSMSFLPMAATSHQEYSIRLYLPSSRVAIYSFLFYYVLLACWRDLSVALWNGLNWYVHGPVMLLAVKWFSPGPVTWFSRYPAQRLLSSMNLLMCLTLESQDVSWLDCGWLNVTTWIWICFTTASVPLK